MESARNIDFPTQIAVGWVLLFIGMVFGFSAHILFSIFERNNFATLFDDPGPRAAGRFLYIFWFISLMPIYTFVVAGTTTRAFRWFIVIVAAVLLALSVDHEIGHWRAGERPDFASHVIDLMHHCVLLWLIVVSSRWALARSAAIRDDR